MILLNFAAIDIYVLSENFKHVCVKRTLGRGGGLKAVRPMFKKTSIFVELAFPNETTTQVYNRLGLVTVVVWRYIECVHQHQKRI